MRISDWSSDVCSSDLFAVAVAGAEAERRIVPAARGRNALFGRADLVFERTERRVVLHRRGHPGLGVPAGRQLGTEIVRQALPVGDSGAGELGQRLVGVGQGCAMGDGVGATAVVGGAGTLPVGGRENGSAWGREGG